MAREVRAAASVARTCVARVRRVLGQGDASASSGLVSPAGCCSYGIRGEGLGIADSFLARFGEGRSILSSLVWGVRSPVGRLLGSEYRRLLWDCVNAILRKSMVEGGVIVVIILSVRKTRPVGEPRFFLLRAKSSPEFRIGVHNNNNLYTGVSALVRASMRVFYF